MSKIIIYERDDGKLRERERERERHKKMTLTIKKKEILTVKKEMKVQLNMKLSP